MRQEDRLGLILQQLNEHGSVGVTRLAETFGVSEASVRRDLHLLEKQKLLTRTHGGAVASGVLYELPMRYRGGQHYEVERALAATRSIRVVTNALNIASELAVRAQIDLVVCGGSARSESYELVGPIAEATLAGINLDVAILGVDGVTAAAGLTTHHEVEAQTNRAILTAAERGIVVTDSTKI